MKVNRKARILVVDDQYAVRRTNINFLSILGYEKFDEAKNGIEAIRKIEAVSDLKGEEFAFVLCDWNMTPMSGFEVLKKVRANPLTKDLVFLMVSAESIQENIISAVQAGVNDYVLKPYNHQTLKDKIRKVADRITQKGVDILNEAKELAKAKADVEQIKEKVNECVKIFNYVALFCHWSPLPPQHLGEVEMFRRKYPVAAVKLRESVSLDYKRPIAHELLAKCYLKMRDLNKALMATRDLAMLAPSNPEFQQRLGDLALRLKRFDEAIAAYKKVAELSKSKEIDKLEKAKRQGKMGEALRGSAEEKDNDPELLQQSEKSLEESLKLNPNYVAAHYNIMMAYKMMGRTAEAAQSFQKAKQISPDNPEDWKDLGKMYLENGDKKQAEFAFHSALKGCNSSQEEELREMVGEAYLEKGMVDEAIRAFNIEGGKELKSIRIFNLLGIAYRKKGETDKAIEEYKKALEIDPKDDGILYNMATAYLEQDKKDEAKECLTKALNINADFEEARTLLSKL